jgi:hypothetical protein
MSITRLARNTIWISFYAKNTKTSTDLVSTTLQYWTLPWLERPSLEVGKGVEILAKPVANSWGSTYKFTRRRIIEEDNEKKIPSPPTFFIKRLFIVTYLLHKTILPNNFLVSIGWSLFARCIVHGSYEWTIMLKKCGRLDLTVFHLIWVIGTYGNSKKNQNPGGCFGAIS